MKESCDRVYTMLMMNGQDSIPVWTHGWSGIPGIIPCCYSEEVAHLCNADGRSYRP